MAGVSLLFSGGLDSTAMALFLLEEGWDVHPVFFKSNMFPSTMKFGIPYSAWLHLNHLLKHTGSGGELSRVEVIEYPFSGVKNKYELPGRNLFFLSYILADFKMADHVGIGIYHHSRESYPDADAEFVRRFRKLISHCAPSFKLVTMGTLGLTRKADVFRRLDKCCVLSDFLRCVRWCLRGVENWHPWGYGCGTCKSCKVARSEFRLFMGGSRHGKA